MIQYIIRTQGSYCFAEDFADLSSTPDLPKKITIGTYPPVCCQKVIGGV